LLEALDELAPTVVALMILFAGMNVPIFLGLGRLAPWTHVSNDHSVLLTSAEWVRVCGSTVPQKSVGAHYMDSTTKRLPWGYCRGGMVPTVNSTVCRACLRRRWTATFLPAGVLATRLCSSEGVATVWPSKLRMTSPTRIPDCCAG
jgi:hypothetical protein